MLPTCQLFHYTPHDYLFSSSVTSDFSWSCLRLFGVLETNMKAHLDLQEFLLSAGKVAAANSTFAPLQGCQSSHSLESWALCCAAVLVNWSQKRSTAEPHSKLFANKPANDTTNYKRTEPLLDTIPENVNHVKQYYVKKTQCLFYNFFFSFCLSHNIIRLLQHSLRSNANFQLFKLDNDIIQVVEWVD